MEDQVPKKTDEVNSSKTSLVSANCGADNGSRKRKKKKKSRKKLDSTAAPNNSNDDSDCVNISSAVKKKASHPRRVSFSPTNRQKNYKNSVRDLRKKKRIGKSAHRSAKSAGILKGL